MSFSTFSGPVRAGTVRYTTGTTAGTIDNTGVVTLVQATVIPAAPGTTTVAVLPAGSQIINFIVDVKTQFNAATTLTLGDGTTANKYLTTTTITGSGDGVRIAQATIDASLVSTYMINVGTSDVKIVATTASTTATAGSATITVVYAQKTDAGYESPADAGTT